MIKKSKQDLPAYKDMYSDVLTALKSLGGSGSNQEIYEKVSELRSFDDAALDVLHNDGPMTEVAYRLRWTQTYLKKYGAITNTKKGTWSIMPRGRDLSAAEIAKLHDKIKSIYKKQRAEKKKIGIDEEADDSISDDLEWNLELLSVLKKMDPSAFERLSQRILRESGFVKVQVTGQSSDGGIDGVGVLRMELVSFQVFFQCKRYKGTVSPSTIRDFRGAMTGRADKGLVITTGTFSTEAKREATRDGAPTIDLIDGDALCDLLKKLNLGVSVQLVEEVTIHPEFFDNL